MPTSSKQHYLEVLQQLVAFAEGDTLSIPVPVLKIGDGILAPNHVTMKQIALATRYEREFLQKDLQHFLRGIANGHASMIEPIKIRIEIITTVHDPPPNSRRRRTRAASYLIEGSIRAWVFNLVDRVLPHVSLETLRSCPSCGRVFVRVTKKRFCSPTCQKRFYMRHWRAEEKKE